MVFRIEQKRIYAVLRRFVHGFSTRRVKNSMAALGVIFACGGEPPDARADDAGVGGNVRGVACVGDGDSLWLAGKRNGGGYCHGGVEVRLHGIDAPEWAQTCRRDKAPGDGLGEEWPCGRAAAEALRGLADGKTATCQVKAIDRYGRRVAVCEAGGVELNREMVRLGLAVAYRRYSADYLADEAEARAAKRGIWAGRFTWPQRWRREHHPR